MTEKKRKAILHCDASLMQLDLSLPEGMGIIVKEKITANCAALRNPDSYIFLKIQRPIYLYKTFTVSKCCFRFVNPPQSFIYSMSFSPDYRLSNIINNILRKAMLLVIN